MERLALNVFLIVKSIRAWGTSEFWVFMCYGWLNLYEIPNLIEVSDKDKRQSEFKKIQSAKRLSNSYSIGTSATCSSSSFTGTIMDSGYRLSDIVKESDSGSIVINSLKDKFTIQGYYYLRDLNVKIASSKYPNFLITALLKLVFNVQWIPGPRP